jgi:hypothetical protein
MIRSWRVMLNEELRNSCSSPDIITMIKPRRVRLAWHAACMGQERREKESNASRVFVGNPEAKRPLEVPKCRWEDNTKMKSPLKVNRRFGGTHRLHLL